MASPVTLKSSPTKLRIALILPVLLCLVILWQTQQLYGSCRTPSEVTSLETLQVYLLDTSRSVSKRSQAAANTLQQLAADIVNNSAEAKQLQQQLVTCEKQATAQQQSGKALGEQVANLTVQLTSHQQQVSQKDGDLKQKEDLVQQLQQQVKEKDEKLKQQVEQLQQQVKDAEAKLKDAEAKLQQQAEQLQQKPTQDATQQPVAIGGWPSQAVAAARLQVLETAGLQCNAVHDQEFWADPIIWGYEHRAQDTGECCAACHAYNAAVERGGTKDGRNATRCNTWAFCADREHCKGRLGECWLKHQKAALPPPPALPPDAHAVKGWVSGVIYPNDTHLQAYGGDTFVLHTALGDIDIKLLPDLAPGSVRELRRMVRLMAHNASACSNCRMYRPEPGFLVQGMFEAPGAYVAVPRHPNPQQPMVMPRGMVCWAGGSGGPHWFVNLIDQSGFKDEHLCWGKAADMTLFDKIVGLPKREKKPGQMNELVDHIRFNVSIKTS